MADNLAPAVYIRLDLFPASIPGIAAVVRAVVTDAHYYFFVDSSSGPQVHTFGVLKHFEGDNKVGYTVIDDTTGESIVFRRSTGCGCGSRLRGFRPFPGVPIRARR